MTHRCFAFISMLTLHIALFTSNCAAQDMKSSAEDCSNMEGQLNELPCVDGRWLNVFLVAANEIRKAPINFLPEDFQYSIFVREADYVILARQSKTPFGQEGSSREHPVYEIVIDKETVSVIGFREAM